MIWMNERRQVKMYKVLNQAKEECVQNVDPSDPKQGNDMCCVHMQGDLTVDKPLEDATFRIQFPNAIRMVRSVEMYQWKQNEEVQNSGQDNETTTYTYEKTWSTEVINSDQFEDRNLKNPTSMPVIKLEETNKTMIGAYKLAESLIGQLSDFKTK